MESLLNEYRESEDSYAVWRLFTIASRLLEPPVYARQSASYRGRTPELLAQTRFAIPYRQARQPVELMPNDDSWVSLPETILARVLLNEVAHKGAIPSLPNLSHLHATIVEEFAVSPYFNTSSRFGASFLKSNSEVIGSKLAVWRLIRLQQQLTQIDFLMHSRRRGARALFEDFEVSEFNSGVDISFDGLNEQLATLLQDLISSLTTITANILALNITPMSDLRAALRVLHTHLTHPGINSWLTSHCAMSVISLFSSYPRNLLVENGIEYSDIEPEIDALQQGLNILLSGTIEGATGIEEPKPDTTQMKKVHKRSYQYSSFMPAPRFVFVSTHGAKPISVEQLLYEKVVYGRELPYSWLNTLPLPTYTVSKLVEHCKDHLIELMNELSVHDIYQLPAPLLDSSWLRVQDTRRMLSLARRIDDNKQLKAISLVLSNAHFLRLASVDIILKLLKADERSRLAGQLFKQRDTFFIEAQDTESLDLEKRLTLANRIQNEAQQYPFRTCVLAASFMSDHISVGMPPLIQEEEMLGIVA